MENGNCSLFYCSVLAAVHIYQPWKGLVLYLQTGLGGKARGDGRRKTREVGCSSVIKKGVRDSPSSHSAREGEGNQSFNPSYCFCGRPHSWRFKLKDQMYNLGIFPDTLLKHCLTVTKLVVLSKVQPLCPCTSEWTLLAGLLYPQSRILVIFH